jgi:hypothetical protein
MIGLPPVRIAKWLGLLYAAIIALFTFASVDAPDVFWLNLLFVPWIIGPAALAAFGAKVSNSRAGEWAFLALEAGLIGSTAASWYYLIEVAPDAQNGVAMSISLPVLQYTAVGAFLVLAVLLGWRAKKGWQSD